MRRNRGIKEIFGWIVLIICVFGFFNGLHLLDLPNGGSISISSVFKNLDKTFDKVNNSINNVGNKIGSSNNNSNAQNQNTQNQNVHNPVQNENKSLEELYSKIKIQEKENNLQYKRAEWSEPVPLFENPDNPGGKRIPAKKLNTITSVWNKTKENNGQFKYLDPYTNEYIYEETIMDRDHIIPLGYVNEHGGYYWDQSKKVEYAYDITVSVNVHRTQNRTKSDKGPSEYLPPANQASYCYTWLVIAAKYDISLSQEDMNVIKNVLNNASEDQLVLINQQK